MLRIYQREDDIVCINEIVEQLLDSSAALDDESDSIDGHIQGVQNLRECFTGIPGNVLLQHAR